MLKLWVDQILILPAHITHFNAVLCDFGMAGPSDEEAKLFSFGYVDPKSMRIVFGRTYFDIYSFGIVLLQLIIQCPGSVMRVLGQCNIIDWVKLEKTKNQHAVAKKLMSGWLKRDGCSKLC